MPNSRHNPSGLAQARALWNRRKWLASAVFAIIFAAFVTMVASLPDLYRATATVLVNPEQVGTLFPDQGGPGSLDARVAAISQQVLSRGRMEGLIKHFNLYTRLRRHASIGAAVTQMRHDIHFERKSTHQASGAQSTVAFTLSYQGWKPRVVAAVTNMLASFYIEDNAKITQQTESSAATSLGAQLRQVAQRLQAQEQRINAFRSAHVAELPQQQEVDLSALDRLNEQLETNGRDQLRAMAMRQRIVHGMDHDGVSIGALERRLAKLRTRYTDNYPDIVRLKAQIAQLRAEQSAKAVAGGAAAGSWQGRLTRVDAQINSLQREGTRLRSEIASYQQHMENIPLVQQQLQALTQGYAETRDVYARLLRRYEEAHALSIASGASNGLFTLIDAARPPRTPTAPSRGRLLFMGILLSLAASVAVVFAFEQFDTSFHTVGELRSFARVPILAQIPRVVTPRDVWRRYVRNSVVAAVTVMSLLVAVGVGYQVGSGNQQLVWLLAKHARTADT